MGRCPLLQEPYLHLEDNFCSPLCQAQAGKFSRTQRLASWPCWQPLGPPRATWRDLISEQRVFSFKLAGIQELPWNLIPVQKYVLNLAQGTSPAMQ